MNETFTGYVTTYALSGGIQKKTLLTRGDGMAWTEGSAMQFFHGEGKAWHRTWESARARAEAMRVAKLVSLEKQAGKIAGLRFEEPEA